MDSSEHEDSIGGMGSSSAGGKAGVREGVFEGVRMGSKTSMIVD